MASCVKQLGNEECRRRCGSVYRALWLTCPSTGVHPSAMIVDDPFERKWLVVPEWADLVGLDGCHVRYWRGCDAPKTLLATTPDDVAERFDGDRLSVTDVDVAWSSRGDEGSTTVVGSTVDSALCQSINQSIDQYKSRLGRRTNIIGLLFATPWLNISNITSPQGPRVHLPVTYFLFGDITSHLVLALSASLRPKYGTPYLFTSVSPSCPL